MFSDCWKMMSDISANGSVSGSDSRIVTGCSHDSNCAARIRYMKTNDSAMAVRNAVAVRFSSRERPTKSARYSGPKFRSRAAATICCCTARLRGARQQVGGERHLALAAHAADRRRRVAVRERRDVVERHDAEPRRRHRQRGHRRLRAAVGLLGAQVHLVLLAASRCRSSPDRRRRADAAPRRRRPPARRGRPPSADRGRPTSRACRRSAWCRRRRGRECRPPRSRSASL